MVWHNLLGTDCYLAAALVALREDIHHLILPDQQHDQEVQQRNGRNQGAHNAESQPQKDSHGVVGDLRPKAPGLLLPQPSSSSSSGGETRLDVVEEQTHKTQESNWLSR